MTAVQGGVGIRVRRAAGRDRAGRVRRARDAGSSAGSRSGAGSGCWSGPRRRSPRSRPSCWRRCRRRTPKPRSCPTRSMASTGPRRPRVRWSPRCSPASPWSSQRPRTPTRPRRRTAMLAAPSWPRSRRPWSATPAPTSRLPCCSAPPPSTSWPGPPVGGLVGLVLTVRALAGRELPAASTLARFSTLAGSLLFAVAFAGAVSPADPPRLVRVRRDPLRPCCSSSSRASPSSSRLIGGWNRSVLLPRVRDAVGLRRARPDRRQCHPDDGGRGLADLVPLGVTGSPVNASPRPVPVEVPPGQTGIAEERSATSRRYAGLLPRRPGRNTLHVQVQDETGEPVTPPRPPVVEVRSGDVDLGEVELPPSGSAPTARRSCCPARGRGGAGVAAHQQVREPGVQAADRRAR